jgi:hypothetical protein
LSELPEDRALRVFAPLSSGTRIRASARKHQRDRRKK